MKLLKFNAEMIDAILAGKKTQTRRPVTGFDVFEPYESGFWRVHGPSLRDCYDEETNHMISAGTCERLVVVEKHLDHYCPYGKSGDFINFHDAEGHPIGEIFLRHIRVERLQDINETNAKAEGVNGGCCTCGNPQPCRCDSPNPLYAESFYWQWVDIYGMNHWNNNPWVWVIEFKRV
ncbi:hypothetical protein [Xenorhabdus littoralis]|uniref:hypothetical protein n=1 Tax=Xenorhabdus littoralis TaxID=2582835 RepID=UPI0029E811A7|nr:hypothetical protein [Xenorhabdus sp. psl]MDX7992626.1 hypothetical protein [Xenorhabdus sp. psl]